MPVNTAKAREHWEAYTYARDNGHLNFIQKAAKCNAYFTGIGQWDPIRKARLDKRKVPALTINKILPTLASVFGEQLDNRAEIAFRPGKDGLQETSEALTQVYLHIAQQNRMDWVETDVAADGFVTSRGFFDVRISYGDSLQGEVKVSRLNPSNVVLDPDASEYDPDTWKQVFLTRWLTADEIAVIYNETDASHLRGKDKSAYDLGCDSIDFMTGTFGGSPSRVTTTGNRHQRIRVVERQYRRLRRAKHFVDPLTGDTREIPADWDAERIQKVVEWSGVSVMERPVEALRWTVVADDVVLFDDWSPYKHFTVVPYFPFLRDGKTLGLVENLLDPQDLLNKTTSQELHVVNTTANSGWKVKRNSLVNMSVEDLETRGAETGLVVELDDINNLDKIQPNQVPTGIERLGMKGDQYIKDISGRGDSVRGLDRADVAARAIEAKQSASLVNLATPLDNLNRTRHLLATRVVDLVQTYYVEERLLNIVASDPRQQTQEVQVNYYDEAVGRIVNDLTVGEYGVVVVTAPARQTYEDSQFDEAVRLRTELGIAIPDSFIIENSHLGKKTELLKALEGTPESQALDEELRKVELEERRAKAADLAASAKVKEAQAVLALVRAKGAAEESVRESTRLMDELLTEPEAPAKAPAAPRKKAAKSV
jgi:hypothetical protein